MNNKTFPFLWNTPTPQRTWHVQQINEAFNNNVGIKVKQTDIQITYIYMVLGIHLLPLSKSHVVTELLTSMPID